MTIAKALAALVLISVSAPSHGADPLAYSYGYVAKLDCNAVQCVRKDPSDEQWGYDQDRDMGVADASGGANLYVRPGADGDTPPLPDIGAQSYVSQAGGAYVAFGAGFAGFKNVGADPLDLVFQIDLAFSAIGGSGFVTPTMAILSGAVVDPAIGSAWLSATYDGRFTANCLTPGAIAIIDPGQYTSRGSQGVNLSTDTAMCDGSNSFRVEPGQTFYLLTRLATFQFGVGDTDALHTLSTRISPLTPQDTLDRLPTALVAVPLAVPEPRTWAALLFGFLLVGRVLRRESGGDQRIGWM
jgi:hypothetical protein